MKNYRPWLPVLSILLAMAVERLAPEKVTKHLVTKHPYYFYLLIALFVLFGIFAACSLFHKGIREWITHKGWFMAAAIALLNLYGIVTKKAGLLPVIYFPTPDRIIGVLVEERGFLFTCLGSSMKLLATGYFSGAIIGFITGIAIGFSRKAEYWIMPFVRLLGPIPSTAWIPIVLISFPTTFGASAFLIGLAVWFPTTVMTSSGIANIQNSYFEVSSTLGATRSYQIFKVGIPAAMPHMFLGLFNGTCASFITLMTAEMLGVKNGIGWYINWQREMLSYANVYTGLIIIAVTFSILVTLLFKVRDRLLVWQKGVVKW